MKHSNVMGGSSALRVINCTASSALAQQFPSAKTPWSREGDALHAYTYNALDAGRFPAADADGTYRWTDEEDGHVVELSIDTINQKFWPAYDAVRALIDEHDIVEYDIEINYAHTQTAGPDVFGTLDFVGRSSRGYTVIVDFKFGSGKRERAKENHQLAFYCVGLWENDEPLFLTGKDVLFVIIQPWREETNITDTWSASMWWLESFRQLERNAYVRIKSGQTSFKMGEWCQFCPAKAACPEQTKNLEDFHIRAPEPAAAHNLDSITLAKLLDMGEAAARKYDALLKYATQLAERGVNFPGWKAIDSYGNRAYKDAAAAERAAISVIGSEAVTKALKSPRQLEKAFRDVKEDFSVMQEHIERPYRGVRLVRDDHAAPQSLAHQVQEVEIPANIIPLKPKDKQNV